MYKNAQIYYKVYVKDRKKIFYISHLYKYAKVYYNKIKFMDFTKQSF